MNQFIREVQLRYSFETSVQQYTTLEKFISQNQTLCKQIRQDIIRSLFLFQDILKVKNISIKQAQCLFERYFFEILIRIPKEIAVLYYQGLTDIFELVFMAYVVPSEMDKMSIQMDIHCDNFKVYTGKINKLFTMDLQNLFIMSKNILMHIYKQNKFDIQTMIKQSKRIHDYIKKYDPVLADLFKSIQTDELHGMLFKLQMNCAIHMVKSYQIAYVLGRLYLISSLDQQALLNQQILSVCVRLTAKQYLNSYALKNPKLTKIFVKYNDTYQIYKNGHKFSNVIENIIETIPDQVMISEFQNQESTIFLLLSQSIEQATIPELEQYFTFFLQNVLQQYSFYRLKSNVKIALTTASLAIGASTGPVGWVCGSMGALLVSIGLQ